MLLLIDLQKCREIKPFIVFDTEQPTYRSHLLAQNQFTNLCIQSQLIGFQADCEQKTFMQVNHSETYIGFDYFQAHRSSEGPYFLLLMVQRNGFQA